MDNQEFINNGAFFAFAIILLLGVFLFTKKKNIKHYISQKFDPDYSNTGFWVLVFLYTYGLLKTVHIFLTTYVMQNPRELPSFISFIYGSILEIIYPFIEVIVSTSSTIIFAVTLIYLIKYFKSKQ